MAPGGGGVYQDVIESNSAAFSDYGIIAPENMEFQSSIIRKSAAVGAKMGMASNSAVHELLECPVCMNIMYPPIHQVKFNFLFNSTPRSLKCLRLFSFH